jgi:4-methyl-5(b-hydroxyethyl)-thiazole monophosphate biosynthesis
MSKKSVLVFLAEGNEESELILPVDILRRAGISVTITSITSQKEVVGSHNITIIADTTIDNCRVEDFDAVFIPGGMPGTINILESTAAVSLVSQFYKSNKICSSICAGPRVLDLAGCLNNKEYTCFPGAEEFISSGTHSSKDIVVDDNIVTGKAMGVATDFGLALVENLLDKNRSEKIANMIYFPSSSN